MEIYLWPLNDANKSMRQLIVHSLEENTQPKEENDKTNLLRGDIAKLFPNVKTVHIWAAGYSFSLSGLMRLIQQAPWNHISVKDYQGDSRPWLLKAWKLNKEAIEKEYAADYHFDFEDNKRLIIGVSQ